MIEKNNTTVQDFLKKEMSAIFEISKRDQSPPYNKTMIPSWKTMISIVPEKIIKPKQLRKTY
jgi:hypothetical protein